MSVLGLDIGGANIKAADDTGLAKSRPFAIWKQPSKLSDEIRSIRADFPRTDRLAVTMTAELADCFATKAEGVSFILDQVQQAAEGMPVLVWTTEGEFVSTDEAVQKPMAVAAANWHGLATWIGQANKKTQPLPASALLIDIGTTTSDFIPLVNGRPATQGLTDVTRLQHGELCYSGVRRTPVCAVAYSVPFRGGYCSIAAELFATMLDVYLLLGDIVEDPSDLETANGKPATLDAAHDRMARALCGDREEVTREEVVNMASFLADVQRQRLLGAMDRVVERLPAPCERVVVSGSGSFLARRLVAQNRRLKQAVIQSLDELISPQIAEAACAYALAQLAASDPKISG